MAYGIFRKVTTLEFLQHHFAKSGHGDGLLMTRQLISTFRQPSLPYLTRSVRRTSGFVLAGYPEVIVGTIRQVAAPTETKDRAGGEGETSPHQLAPLFSGSKTWDFDFRNA